jgi:glycosyltransferase involved in cell wall biosynthesis
VVETETRQKVTCVIGTKNSEADIKDCLESAKFLDEIVVIDDLSIDKTVALARQYTDKVIERKLTGYPEQMDAAIQAAGNRWILILDADEVITPELRDEINRKMSSQPGDSGFFLRRLNFFLGREIRHCGWYEKNNLRLFDKEKINYDLSMKYLVRMNISGTLGELDNDLLHFTCKDLYSYFKRMNLWSSLNTEDLIDKGYRITLVNSVYYFFFKPLAIFLYKYFLKLGFMDGFEGFLICAFSSFTYFLSYVKLSRRQKMSMRRVLWRNPWGNDPVFPGKKRFTEKSF